MDTEYYLIPKYTMKCRLYPNKAQAKAIDDAIYAVQIYHNCVMWDLFHNFTCTKEVARYKYKKTEKQREREKKWAKRGTSPKHDPNLPVHKIGPIAPFFKASYKERLTSEHPIIEKAPAGALTTKVGLQADMKRSLELVKTDNGMKNDAPIEDRKPRYYSSSDPRRSYTYQETASKLTDTENRNVLRMNLAKIGFVKIRGWNQKIRFDKDGKLDFPAWFQNNPKKQMTITVSKDACGDYWICFSLSDVYKAFPVCSSEPVGIDAGISSIAIVSDGQKFENKKFKKEVSKRHRALNRRLSRRQGWSNIRFREEKKTDASLPVSRSYIKTKKALSKLDRRTAWKRSDWNHWISCQLVQSHSFIGVESLNVKGMFRNRHLANALSDAAIYQLLQMLNYKSHWYGRTIQPIDQWTPSSKRCSTCKDYLYQRLTLSVREWTCPVCGMHHDRDINAAKNILDYALDISKQASA